MPQYSGLWTLMHFKITFGRGGALRCSKYLLWTQSQWTAHVKNKKTIINSVCDVFANKRVSQFMKLLYNWK